MAVTRQGAGIYFPYLPSHFNPEPPRPTQDLKRNALCLLSQLLPSTSFKNKNFTNKAKGKKRKRLVLLSVVQAKGAVHCIPKLVFSFLFPEFFREKKSPLFSLKQLGRCNVANCFFFLSERLNYNSGHEV